VHACVGTCAESRGWGCQMFNFIFLKRDRSQDSSYMVSTHPSRHACNSAHSNRAQSFLSQLFYVQKNPVQLLIFPEGTDLSPSNKSKSNEWARREGKKLYDHVLHPRNESIPNSLNSTRHAWISTYLGETPSGYQSQDLRHHYRLSRLCS
jgi:1-acyl-sn-glycerol-3-phosphate acyltransferase